ncbi:Hypothetical predicted protein [Pelobates cultripes]|uniref:Uncharacterized protein n=1 Tax=Pelobates cultripes TaxID=61616 RepID=A0AAD1SEZ6_PELCU|nr:Hypothetical predicted protein [Pelobates cultripes]
MPFLYTARSGKLKRRPKAYQLPTIHDLENLIGGAYKHEQPNICALLQRQAQSIMAPTTQTPSCSPAHSSSQTELDTESTMPATIAARGDNTLATKRDLQNWFQDIQEMLSADMEY